MKWFLQRGVSIVLLTFLIFIASHLIIRLIPGDPVDVIMAETGTSIPREVLLRDLELDRPVWQAIPHQIIRAFQGDLGQSIHHKAPIAPLLAQRTLNSLILAFAAISVGLFLALS